MTGDYHSDNIRESLLKLDQTPARASNEMGRVEPGLYDSLRKLSRTRVALTLRQLRASHGFSYAQVQTDTGLSQQFLFDVEFGDRRLSLEELTLLASCYEVSVSDILGVDIK